MVLHGRRHHSCFRSGDTAGQNKGEISLCNTYQHMAFSNKFAIFLQGFAAHNGEILSAAVIPSSTTMGTIVLTGGHDWQASDGIRVFLFSLRIGTVTCSN